MGTKLSKNLSEHSLRRKSHDSKRINNNSKEKKIDQLKRIISERKFEKNIHGREKEIDQIKMAYFDSEKNHQNQSKISKTRFMHLFSKVYQVSNELDKRYRKNDLGIYETSDIMENSLQLIKEIETILL